MGAKLTSMGLLKPRLFGLLQLAHPILASLLVRDKLHLIAHVEPVQLVRFAHLKDHGHRRHADIGDGPVAQGDLLVGGIDLAHLAMTYAGAALRGLVALMAAVFITGLYAKCHAAQQAGNQ